MSLRLSNFASLQEVLRRVLLEADNSDACMFITVVSCVWERRNAILFDKK